MRASNKPAPRRRRSSYRAERYRLADLGACQPGEGDGASRIFDTVAGGNVVDEDPRYRAIADEDPRLMQRFSIIIGSTV